ncbi:lipase member J-like [Solenopsis invicta]|uniref:lipase member J-like n=1 Tax=Solenopsis invicta TaxID=13686 RepID=UPI00193D4D53|nr:lipase member J-like [Solenopsis invicta]
MVEQYGYPAEEYNVTTEDGYNLIIHRIPGSLLLDNNVKKEIVFFQHGMLASSKCWLMYGPGKDLAFLLADRGYDVWFGNMRGLTYCRSHVNMTTNDRKFWQITKDEYRTSVGELVTYYLDLCSLQTVKQCAKEIITNEATIDILINNAGVCAHPYEKTIDENELTLQSTI